MLCETLFLTKGKVWKLSSKWAENVRKCFHRKTGENYPLSELVIIKMFLKEECENGSKREIAT